MVELVNREVLDLGGLRTGLLSLEASNDKSGLCPYSHNVVQVEGAEFVN